MANCIIEHFRTNQFCASCGYHTQPDCSRNVPMCSYMGR